MPSGYPTGKETTMNTAANIHVNLAVDENGLLINPEDWDEDIAHILARESGIPFLGPDHWKVIYALRKHYDKFGVAPAMHNVCHQYGKDDAWVHNLFHTCMDAWRIAGMPDPGEETRAYLSDM
jgi:dissimilatory sulfite reductase related protein